MPSIRQTILFVFDAPPPIAGNIPSPLLDDLRSEQLDDPFWIYTRLASEVVRLQDTAVWAIRNQVRAMETARPPAGQPQPDYRRLHDIARHAIHVSETLEVAAGTMEHILEQHVDTMAEAAADNRVDRVVNEGVSRDIHHQLRFFQHMISSLRSRSMSNKERLLNEIQLAFNTVAQYDSAISVAIGRAAQVDSAAIKTVAFLTLLFLPATFLSAISNVLLQLQRGIRRVDRIE